MNVSSRFRGCIIGGAIGDAYGSGYENILPNQDSDVYYPFEKQPSLAPDWQITDDTQLTLITCEYLTENETVNAESLAQAFLKAYKAKKINGLGSSTLKALRELEVGGHWSLVGRRGEYAAGNGAAMRIAPFAFIPHINKKQIREICSITHVNDEAYLGAMCVVLSIRAILNNEWVGDNDLREILIEQIPDTRIRDRLIHDYQNDLSIEEIGEIGNNGYVVNSIPLAISAANKVLQTGFKSMFDTLIKIGGDTDTNCSIAGQVAGALLGVENLPLEMKERLQQLPTSNWINTVIEKIIIKGVV